MRILIDQSGYDLLNVGDVAMLQSCVARLRQQWPDSEMMIVAHHPARLSRYCPGTVAIGKSVADAPVLRHLPRKPSLLAEQAWKSASPYLSGRLTPGRPGQPQPRTVTQAVKAADLVVASGGGYLTDTWWWHAAGVLSLLSLAQRLGKPTAMFGQGIGPLQHPALRVQARSVLPRLSILGLREQRTSEALALSLGARTGTLRVTGDDALELVDGAGSVPAGDALGVNLRVSDYAGVAPASAAAVGEVVTAAAEALRTRIVALPISRYAADADLAAIRAMLGPARDPGRVVLDDLASPQEVAAAAARCRAIVTGSYHAAVFALAQGVPAVCLSRSAYYDVKFAGLQALFPSACTIVALGQQGFAEVLRAAIDRAWHLPAAARSAARAAAVYLRDAGQATYGEFRDAVEHSTVAAHTNRKGLGR